MSRSFYPRSFGARAMITGMTSPFSELEKLPYRFELTGSRAIGNWNTDSDWDFFAQYSIEAENALYKLEFNENEEISYKTSAKVLQKGNIHIQLVEDFELKLRAQHLIKSTELRRILYRLDKKDRKHVWTYALNEAKKVQLTSV